MKKTSIESLSQSLKITKSRSLEAILKAQLISQIQKQISEEDMTHSELSARSGLPRSAVTGILSGSLQKVTLDRILRLVEAAGLTAEIKIKKIA